MTLEEELARVRAENAALDEQLKVAIRAEQRTFLVQRELGAQLARVKALTELAIVSSSAETEQALFSHVVQTMRALFPVDCVLIVEGPRDALRVWSGEGPARPVAPAPPLAAWLHQGTEATVIDLARWREAEETSALFALAAELGLPDPPDAATNLAAIVTPARQGIVALFAWKSVARHRSVLRHPIKGGLEQFFALVGEHLRHSVDRIAMTRSLAVHGEELARANASLESSLVSLRDAEHSLRHNEAKFRSLFQQTTRLAGTLALDGTLLDVNRTALRFAGATEDAVLQRKFWDTPWWAHSAAERDRVRAAVEAAARGTSGAFETSHLDGDGRPRHIDFSVNPVFGAHGELVCLLVEGHDVTDGRRAVLALRESERRLAHAIAATSDAIWEWSVATGEWYFSPRWYEMLGYADRQMPMGFETWEGLCHPDDRPVAAEAIAETLRSTAGLGYRAEFRMRRADGRWAWILARGNVVERDEIGAPLRLSGTNSDITDSKRQEGRALALKELAAALLDLDAPERASVAALRCALAFTDGADGAVHLVDAKGSVQLAAQEGRPEDVSAEGAWASSPEVIALSRAETPVVGSAERVAPELVARRQLASSDRLCALPIAVEGPPGALLVVRVRPPEGIAAADVHWLEDVGAQLGSALARIRARAEKRRIEEQLLHALKMESIGRLAGGVAHDFNNLLTAITGNVALALLDLEPQDPIAEILRDVERAGESATVLTRQLLAFSRRQVIQPRLIDFDELLGQLQKLLPRLIGEDIDLRLVRGRLLGSVRVDPVQFEQVVINLAVNARDAMPDGGRLVIETTNVELSEDDCASMPELSAGRYVLLRVSDTGHGMSAEVRERVFEPFFTTKALGRGTGLGLATVYGAVSQAGGAIEVRSEVGRGTTFEIYLPRADRPVVAAAADGPSPALPGGGETLLVVEDDRFARDLAVRVLTRAGYSVVSAENAERALQLLEARKLPVQLLVTDVVMPGMNGRQLAERLRAIQPEARVLYTSGYAENVIIHRGVLSEGLHFIGKPYSPQALAAKVREVLDAATSAA
jgi:PAS domain S-box-containing protein